MLSKLTCVRHGSTSLNADDGSDKIRAWEDLPLDEGGTNDAKKLAKKLQGSDIDGMITSDLIRARQTAQIIEHYAMIPIISRSFALRPWDLGIYTGRLTKEVLPELRKYNENPDEVVPEGESFNTFKNRFLGEITKIINQYEGHLAIVTHHRDERLFAAWHKKGMPDDFSFDEATFLQKGIDPATLISYMGFNMRLENTLILSPDKIEALKNLKNLQDLNDTLELFLTK